MMNEEQLFLYIKNRTYCCVFCKLLQWKVMEEGLSAIDNWDSMICGSIEDMKIRLWEIRTGQEWVSIDPFDLFEGEE